jgi:uncharacterized protein (DUF4415 family)
MLDEDIIEHFKRLAARPNATPYQTQINQALRDSIGKALPIAESNVEGH